MSYFPIALTPNGAYTSLALFAKSFTMPEQVSGAIVKAAKSTTPGATGAGVDYESGDGADGDATHDGAAGGQMTVRPGSGGAGTALRPAGGGQNVLLLGGDGGPNNGGGGAGGGGVEIDSGVASGAATSAGILIGTVHAASVQIGRTGIITGVAGRFSFNGSQFDATYTLTSNITGSAGFNMTMGGNSLFWVNSGVFSLAGGSSLGIYIGTVGLTQIVQIPDNTRWDFLKTYTVKAHAAFTSSESFTTTGAVATTDATPTSLLSVALADNFAYWFEFDVVGRKSDGTSRAYSKKVCLAYRAGAGSVIEGATTLADLGDAGGLTWDVSFATSGNNIVVQVTGFAVTTVRWTGTVKYQAVSGTA